MCTTASGLPEVTTVTHGRIGLIGDCSHLAAAAMIAIAADHGACHDCTAAFLLTIGRFMPAAALAVIIIRSCRFAG
jgi:hypothetical protein